MVGIYKITNKINGKVYIGQSINIQQRWKQHRTNASVREEILYRAFQKYGIENFSFEVIEECDENCLDEKEQYYISYYDSYNNGYNMTQGGQHNKDFYSSKIFQLWDEGKSILEISNILNLNRATIWNRLKDYKNYDISQSHHRSGKIAYLNMLDRGTVPEHMKPKLIYQYDLWGNYVGEWISAKQICRELGIDNSLIGQVLNGKYLQAGGYQWTFEERANNIIDKVKSKFGIVQKDLANNIINLWVSLNEIEENTSMKKSSISKCLKGKQQTTYGYKWEYDFTIWDSKPYERGISSGFGKGMEKG